MWHATRTVACRPAIGQLPCGIAWTSADVTSDFDERALFKMTPTSREHSQWCLLGCESAYHMCTVHTAAAGQLQRWTVKGSDGNGNRSSSTHSSLMWCRTNLDGLVILTPHTMPHTLPCRRHSATGDDGATSVPSMTTHACHPSELSDALQCDILAIRRTQTQNR